METLNSVLPKYGDIALCQGGFAGLVLEEMDGVCYGIHLGRLKLGEKWQSASPEIIGNIYEYLEDIKNI
jgi:hypothetical protein